jgi:hypothetical protein
VFTPWPAAQSISPFLLPLLSDGGSAGEEL